jgi:hypothetical protein
VVAAFAAVGMGPDAKSPSAQYAGISEHRID